MNIDYTRLIKRLEPEPDGESAVRHRSGLVDAVNADGTVDLDLSGVVIPSVSVLDGAHVGVGDTVQVAAWAGDLLVLGRARETANAGGVLGYAQVTSPVGSIVGTPVNLANTGNISIPANRLIGIIGGWPSAASTVALDRINLRLASSAIYMEQLRRFEAANTAMHGGTIAATFDSAAGGSLAFAIQALRLSGTGTITVNASANAPVWVRVTDLGPT